MKKLIAAATGTLLLGALAFSACASGNEPEGEIKGDYVEITGSELTEKLDGLTPEKLFGDPAQKDWSWGFEFSADIEVEADVTAEQGEKTEQFLKLDVDENSTIKAMLAASEDKTALGGLSVKMQNNNKLKGALGKSDVLGIEEDKEFEYSINTHIADGYLYLQIPDMHDLPLPFEIAEGKFKMPMEYILSSLTNLLPDTLARAAEGNEETTQDLLTTYKLKAYADDSDGLKIKISADEQSLYSVLEQFTGITAENAKKIASFNDFAIDLYFETAADGKFEKAGLVADIDGSLTAKAGDLGEGVPALLGPVKVEMDLSLKKFLGEIILPTEDQLKEYVDITEDSESNN